MKWLKENMVKFVQIFNFTMRGYLVKLKKWSFIIIENIFYYGSSAIAFLFFLWCIWEVITKTSDLPQIFNLITSFMAISTISAAIYTFISNNRAQRLKYAIRIVENFDRKDFRKARNLTRAIGKVSDKIATKTLKDLIDDKLSNKDVKKLQKLCKFSSKDCQKLEESVIFTFNYWEGVYDAIQYNAVNDDYVKEHLCSVYISQYERFSPWFREKFSKTMLDKLENFYTISKTFIKSHR